MPTITHTPEPYSCTILSLSAQEQAQTNGRVQTVTLFPPTVSATAQDIFPAGFQITAPSGHISENYPYGEINVLPAQLQGLAQQIMTDYIRQGPVPAPPALSAQAERARSGRGFLGLGVRKGKGRWV